MVRKDEGAKENHKYILSTLSKGKITHILVPTEYIKVKDVMEDVKKLVASCSHVEICQKPLQRPEGEGDRVKVRINPLACRVCTEDVPFEDSRAKERHVRENHRVGECLKCGGFFPAKKLAGHKKKCLLPQLKCDTCDFTTFRVDVMETHKKSHQRKFSCLYPGCDIVCPSLEERRKHRATQHPSRFPCSHCDKSFTRAFNRERHVKLMHWGMHAEDGGDDGAHAKRKQKLISRKVHDCRHKECDYKTTLRMRLETHMRRVHGAHKPRHQCSGCHKIFQDKRGLRRHTEGLKPCKKYQCSRPRIVQMWSNRGMIRVYKKQDGLSKRRFFKLIRDLQKEFDGKLIY